MPKICYVEKNFQGASLELINLANEIIDEIQGDGYDLTLRQLYYQLVARGHIPNSERSYKRLGNVISDGRLAGLIDWNAIVDRTRNLRRNSHWNDPSQIISSAAYSYANDKWADQEYRVEVWIEKDALVGVIARICETLDVPYFSCRGYTSQSEMWAAGQRLQRYINRGQTPIILHLGDHDPSGIDMTRDIDDRLALFMGGTEIQRLALNYDQVEQYNPPPNPAKLSDSRAEAYIAEFGRSSWELDALPPAVLSQLVEDAVAQWRDEEAWNASLAREERGAETLRRVANQWDEVASLFGEEE